MPNLNTIFNFKWQPVSHGLKFRELEALSGVKQFVNHLENHKEISTKSRLFESMKKYWESIKTNVFDVIPLTFYIDIDPNKTNSKFTALSNFYTVYNILEESKKSFKKLWFDNETDMDEKYVDMEFFKESLSGKTQRESLFSSKLTFYSSQNKFNSMYTRTTMPLSHFWGQNFWILKATNLNRGRGIHVFRDLKSLHKLIDEYWKGWQKKPFKTSKCNNDLLQPNSDRTQPKLGGLGMF